MSFVKHAVPADDPSRGLVVVKREDPRLTNVSMAGGIYTILVTGEDTGGRYTLIDMNVPPGGGPGPHRHDFEEMFTLLEGEIEFTFRGEKTTVRKGETVNIPSNAPHSFKNVSSQPARLHCMCTPAGQEEFFQEVAVPVEGHDSPPPVLSANQKAEMMSKIEMLAPKYHTEME